MHNQTHNIKSSAISLSFNLYLMKTSISRETRKWHCKEIKELKKIYLFVSHSKYSFEPLRVIRILKLTQTS